MDGLQPCNYSFKPWLNIRVLLTFSRIQAFTLTTNRHMYTNIRHAGTQVQTQGAINKKGAKIPCFVTRAFVLPGQYKGVVIKTINMHLAM